MRLLQEWDIVLNCLNLGFLFTQMLPHAPIPEFQSCDSSPTNSMQQIPPMTKSSIYGS
jgi:hypothetical protein